MTSGDDFSCTDFSCTDFFLYWFFLYWFELLWIELLWIELFQSYSLCSYFKTMILHPKIQFNWLFLFVHLEMYWCSTKFWTHDGPRRKRNTSKAHGGAHTKWTPLVKIHTGRYYCHVYNRTSMITKNSNEKYLTWYIERETAQHIEISLDIENKE